MMTLERIQFKGWEIKYRVVGGEVSGPFYERLVGQDTEETAVNQLMEFFATCGKKIDVLEVRGGWFQPVLSFDPSLMAALTDILAKHLSVATYQVYKEGKGFDAPVIEVEGVG